MSIFLKLAASALVGGGGLMLFSCAYGLAVDPCSRAAETMWEWGCVVAASSILFVAGYAMHMAWVTP